MHILIVAFILGNERELFVASSSSFVKELSSIMDIYLKFFKIIFVRIVFLCITLPINSKRKMEYNESRRKKLIEEMNRESETEIRILKPNCNKVNNRVYLL